METAKLKKFAQFARRNLMEQVSAKLKQVLVQDSPARRENPEAVKKLEESIRQKSQSQVVEQVAYTWFNRFCALRFMDVNRYNRINVVSPLEGQFQPEILAEAKMGHIDEEMIRGKLRQQILDLLNGRATSRDPQGEAYRLLIVGVCNYWHKFMPFLFERIDDYTELLMPEDLLSGNAILAYTREAMTPEVCKDVEVIGWLYQYYISEKKDAVFDGLKKNRKITPENIPAATQLFTPHWIVRYLVENSLGRLWMLNRPNSKLAAQMDYYIKPEQPETDILKINSPEEIRICDPACGSGHILVYAFDLLHAIYEEEGYEPTEIPAKILRNNLYGIEIDERAGALAAFALTMKTLQYDKRFFRRPAGSSPAVAPHICVLKNIRFGESELNHYMDFVGRNLFTAPLQTTLRQFEEADNFGSLIRPYATDTATLRSALAAKKPAENLFLSQTHHKVLQVLQQADYLSPKYHVVVANPPYMGGKGMNSGLKSFAQKQYPATKSDLFAMFTERILEFVRKGGFVGLMTPFNWMFLSSFEKLRKKIIDNNTITNLVRPEFHAFFDSAFVSICGFTLFTKQLPSFKGAYIDLSKFYGADLQPQKTLEAIKNPDCGWFFRAVAADFKKIPGSPIAYWLKGIHLFENKKLGDYFISGGRNKTHNNELYLRYSWEVCNNNTRWVSYANGGDFRKYSGNEIQLIDWSGEAKSFYEYHGGLCNSKFWNKEGITWSLITSAKSSFRIKNTYSLYSSGSPTIFNKNFTCDKKALAFLNSPIAAYYLKAINPTLNTTVNDVFALPFLEKVMVSNIIKNTDVCIYITKSDWDSYETSWDFTRLPLLQPEYRRATLSATYQTLRQHWQQQTLQMQQLEEENNRIFIAAYGLQEELTPEVPLSEITLTCNPHYRYNGNKSAPELEELLLADTLREFISYAVGCMFGRYALEKPGLILADQGETLADFVRIVDEYLVTRNEKGNPDEHQQLPGSDRVAEGDGRGGDDLSGDQEVSEGGDLRIDESDSESGSIDTVEYSGRSGTQVNTGLQKIFANRPGIESRSGDSTSAGKSSELSNSGTVDANPESTGRNQQNDERTSSQTQVTPNAPLTTHYSPLNTKFSFLPDEDNVIPMLDGDWFTDDIAERFRKFLRITFGEAHYEENLAFIETALGKDIRRYFLRDFYNDHVRRYKKRPIYWLFSSPKGSFNALIYMHRYRPDTVSIVLNDYLREFRTKLAARREHLLHVEASAGATKTEKTRALKEIESLRKMIDELDSWEREVLYPLATQQIEIDLDDGVKVNYPKFGAALKKIPGLDTTED